MKTKADMVFEASWEVCNKCGGIHTVVTSKVPLMQSYYNTYTLIGPLFDKLPTDFIESRPPEPFARVFSELSHKGIRFVYGTWDILGSPNVLLVDARSLSSDLDSIKTDLYNNFGVESLGSSWDFNEPMLWSIGVGMFLEGIQGQFPHNKIVGHFHEWLSGFALLYLKSKNSKVASVFTTHATMLGRSLASRGMASYNSIGTVDPHQAAKDVGVLEKFTTERACALNASVFSTVSDITAKEANTIFGRMPSVLPNGLPMELYPTFEQTSYDHKESKKKLKHFVMSHFFPYNTFDLDDTLFYYSSGRYEFENKGLDITIDALGRLNNQLKDACSSQTIVMFFFVAMDSLGPKRELLENKMHIEDLEDDIVDLSDYFNQQIILDVIMGDKSKIEVVPKEFISSQRRKFKSIKRTGNPPLCTHNLSFDESKDPIISHCTNAGLLNRADDRVKVVFLPAYLEGRDGLLNMDYYETIVGCHLGILPSYYEPWGYTPLESIAYGVPAITSNTAGFAKWVEDKIPNKNKGLYIVDRSKSRDEEVSQLFSFLDTFAQNNVSTRVACKMNARSLASYADWKDLIKFYICAHNEALGAPCSPDECVIKEDD